MKNKVKEKKTMYGNKKKKDGGEGTERQKRKKKECTTHAGY